MTRITGRCGRIVEAARSLCVGLVLLSGHLHAATVVSDATLVANEGTAASREFVVPASGRYELQVDDVGFPAPLQSLQAVVTRGDARVASLGAPGKMQFDAQGGPHELHVAGVAAVAGGFGSFAVRVVPLDGSAPIVDYSDAVARVTVPAPDGQTTLQAEVALAESARYAITLVDASFPEALASAEVLLTRGGNEYARLNAAATSAEFDAVPGTYDLLMVARPGPRRAGLYGVRIVRVSTGDPVYDAAFPVGRLGPARAVTLPSSGTGTLSVADLGFPAALASASAALLRGTTIVAMRLGAGETPFDAGGGAAQVYALPETTSESATGALSIDISQGGTRVDSTVHVASPPPSSNAQTLSIDEVTVAAPGALRTVATDFDFPGTLLDLQVAAYQAGVELGRRSGPGQFDAQAAAGTVVLLTAATPNATTRSGLFGIEIAPPAGGAPLLQITRAVGARFESRRITVPSSGSYDVALSDLDFPDQFEELSLAVTRGTQRVGFVFGAGRFTFQAVPGDYFFNFITRVSTQAGFGTFGLDVSTTPPAPVVTLIASPATVVPGGSTTLNWSATGATACVASGAWSGNRPASGTESTVALSAESVYTLTCNGPGGSDSETVTVSLRRAASDGGGGRAGLSLLLLALASTFARPVTRRGTDPR